VVFQRRLRKQVETPDDRTFLWMVVPFSSVYIDSLLTGARGHLLNLILSTKPVYVCGEGHLLRGATPSHTIPHQPPHITSLFSFFLSNPCEHNQKAISTLPHLLSVHSPNTSIPPPPLFHSISNKPPPTCHCIPSFVCFLVTRNAKANSNPPTKKESWVVGLDGPTPYQPNIGR
jgi:hypothetical protein